MTAATTQPATVVPDVGPVTWPDECAHCWLATDHTVTDIRPRRDGSAELDLECAEDRCGHRWMTLADADDLADLLEVT